MLLLLKNVDLETFFATSSAFTCTPTLLLWRPLYNGHFLLSPEGGHYGEVHWYMYLFLFSLTRLRRIQDLIKCSKSPLGAIDGILCILGKSIILLLLFLFDSIYYTLVHFPFYICVYSLESDM